MNHFLKKNISNLQGAGKKGGGGGGSPPPAELQPPKLGKLQTLASYSYLEVIDLVSDGPIDGIVNQNGQYLHGHRIFEGIYFDNTPVKKSFDASYTGTNPISSSSYSLANDASFISGLWYRSGQFFENDFTGIRCMVATGSLTGNLVSGRTPCMIRNNSYFADHTPVNDPYLSLTHAPISHTGNSGNLFACPDPYTREKHWEITWTRNDIAKSIYKSIDLLKTVSNEPSSYGETASEIAKQKTLRYNFQSWLDVRDAILPFPINENDNDYPIFAVKFEIGSPFAETISNDCGSPLSYFYVNEKQLTVSSDFTIDRNTTTVLSDDIANQVSQKLEFENIKKDHIVQPIQFLDLTYAQKTTSTNIDVGGSIIVFGFKDGSKAPYQDSIDAIKRYISSLSIIRPDNEKYNYNNVLSEIRNGDELQKPLSYFSKVYIDREYGTKLVGPFDVSKQIMRVSNFDDDTGFRILGTYEFPLLESLANEGSSDTRNGKDFSSYAGNGRTQFIEAAIPITHVIENPNVDQVFISIGVRALNDTNQVDSAPQGLGTVQAGSRIPSAIRFKVEIGLQNAYGQDVESSIEERVYQIVGLADSAAVIDIGRSEISDNLANYKFINGSSDVGAINASTAIILPEAAQDAKRFVRITRTTYESSSVLIKREISLEKVTEVVNTKFSYPGSAIVGTKIDSRTLSTVPPRSFDLRLKRVLVPSNYFPLAPDGKDKRRYKTATEFNAATSDDLQIYRENWDGTFKMSWTDNPAWVLFDILTNSRYGLGSFVEHDQVNIWELYKIGRFCDGVDRNGVFSGVDNGLGGKEPRYSINVIIADKINVFDALNSIASVFRGNIFYSNSLIDFTDDRLKLPIMEFCNSNVKDGVFSYTNSRKDQEFNVVEVSYLDENDNFKSKIEYVENSDDIRKRGILSTNVDSFGVTSKSLANRIGKHVLYATTKENQAVNFIGGIESLILKPGDLISINDELKTQQRNFGRILDINEESGEVYINEKFLSNAFLQEITLFAPTGTKNFNDLLGVARQSGGIAFRDIHEGDVPQIQTFMVSGYDNSPEYGSRVFVKPTVTYDLIRFTGTSSVTGTGLYSGVGSLNGYSYYTGITNPNLAIYRSSYQSGMTTIVENYWSLRSGVSGNLLYSGASGMTKPYSGIWNYGGCVYTPAFDNINRDFLSRVKVGSPYGISLSGVEREIYKINSIRESNINEYEVSASKFDTGKFAEIESSQNLNDFYETFSFIPAPSSHSTSLSDTQTYQLQTPAIVAFQTGNYDGQNDTLDISGRWSGVAGATTYLVNVISPNGTKTTAEVSTTGYVVNDQSELGFYRLNVSAKNSSLGYSSRVASSGLYVFATDTYITPYIKDIKIN